MGGSLVKDIALVADWVVPRPALTFSGNAASTDP